MTFGPRWTVCLAVLSLTAPALGQFQRSPSTSIEEAARATAPSQPQPQPDSPTETKVLSDLKGFKIQPYLDTVLDIVRRQWYSTIRETVSNPERRNGKVVAEFTITRSGRIQDIKIVSASGEADLDDAVSAGLRSASPLPALPKTLPRDEIKLRISYYYKAVKDSRWWKRR